MKQTSVLKIAVVIMAVAFAVWTISFKSPYDPEPPGIIHEYGGTTAPTGYLICDGAAVSRTTYAALFAVTGTAFGAGDGSTTFNLPDMRQKFALGVATSGTGSTLGGTGGIIDHSHGSPITSGTPSTTVAATNLTGSAASTTHTHSVTLTAQNPPFVAVNYVIKY